MALTVLVDDIEARWRPLSEAETSVAEALIADALGILRAKRPALEAAVDAADLDHALVTAVVAQMVLRVLRNPDGKRQESVDDYSYVRDNAVSTGLLYVADEELALLQPTVTTSAAFSITPAAVPWVRSGWPPCSPPYIT